MIILFYFFMYLKINLSHVLPELWPPEFTLLIGLSLGLSVFSPGWGLLGTEELALAKNTHTCTGISVLGHNFQSVCETHDCT